MDDSDSGYFTPLHPTRLDLLELRSRSILKSRKRGRRAIAPDSPSRRRDLEECDSPSPLIYHENRSTTTTRYHRTDLISYQSVVEALNASYNSIWQTSPFTFLRSRLLEIQSTPSTSYTYAQSCGYLVGSLFNEVDEPNLARNGLVRIGSESRLQRWSFYPLVVLLFIFACIRSLFASLFDIMRLRSGTDTGDSPVRRSARVSVRENETIYQNNTTRIIREREKTSCWPFCFWYLICLGTILPLIWFATPRTHIPANSDSSQLFADISSEINQLRLSCCDKSGYIGVQEFQGLIDLVEESNRNSLLGRQANDENLAMIREKFDVFVKAYKNDVRDLRDKEAANSLALTELRNALENVRIRAKASGSVSQDEVSRIVALQLSRYDADKTGLPDFALENSGAEVVSVRCTNLMQSSMKILWWGFVPYYWEYTGHPRNALQPDMRPGSCFAFTGFPGMLVVKLATSIRPTAVSIEHLPKSVSHDGKIDTAPYEFEVYALRGTRDVENPQLLVEGRFNADGLPLQTFQVQDDLPPSASFRFIELRILSNHGNTNHTCLYRFRVHGIPMVNPSE